MEDWEGVMTGLLADMDATRWPDTFQEYLAICSQGFMRFCARDGVWGHGS